MGRNPNDAPYLTERICGVCPVSHGRADRIVVVDTLKAGE